MPRSCWEHGSPCANQPVTTENAPCAFRSTGCLAPGSRRDQDGPQGSWGGCLRAIRSLDLACGGGHCPGACQQPPAPNLAPPVGVSLVLGWHPLIHTWECSGCRRALAGTLHLGLPQRHEHASMLFGGTCGPPLVSAVMKAARAAPRAPGVHMARSSRGCPQAEQLADRATRPQLCRAVPARLELGFQPGPPPALCSIPPAIGRLTSSILTGGQRHPCCCLPWILTSYEAENHFPRRNHKGVSLVCSLMCFSPVSYRVVCRHVLDASLLSVICGKHLFPTPGWASDFPQGSLRNYSLLCGGGRIFQSFMVKGFCILFRKSLPPQHHKGQGSLRDRAHSGTALFLAQCFSSP